jgi:L-aspartate oxidase
VVHAGDFTGRAIQKALIDLVRDNDAVTLLRDHVAVDVITGCKLKGACSDSEVHAGAPQQRGRERCLGMYVLDVASGEVKTITASVTVLATGGAGKVYLYTSNPDVSTGDGIAIAYRAGARVANLEFVQFHPTCLYHHKAKNFLISEALRGEGARLIDASGNAFMEKYDPERKDLACRDIVARAIDAELKRSGEESVFLDISHRPADFIKRRFPNIYRTCFGFGMDITREPIPVVPAAHYMCGGIVTDGFGRTDISCLFAVGETACTGLHGANRLASNSLLEGLVMAHQAFLRISADHERLKTARCPPIQPWDTGGAVDMDEAVLISHNWDVIRRLMWDYVGIVRSDRRLSLARRRIKPIIDEINRHYWDYILTRDFLELRNLSMVAKLIVHAASQRKESRGGHFNMDWPQKDDWNWRRDSLLCRDTDPE